MNKRLKTPNLRNVSSVIRQVEWKGFFSLSNTLSIGVWEKTALNPSVGAAVRDCQPYHFLLKENLALMFIS